MPINDDEMEYIIYEYSCIGFYVPWGISLLSRCLKKIHWINNLIQETVPAGGCFLQDRVRAVTLNGCDAWDQQKSY